MSTPGYRVLQWTQTWYMDRETGAWYRKAYAVRLADGQRRLVGILDDEDAAA